MIRHYYTLKKVAASMQCLIGGEVGSCFSQEKDSAVISVDIGGSEKFLVFYSSPANNSIQMRNSFSRARRNSADIFPDIAGERIQSIALDPNDRIIRMKLIFSELVFVMFGGSSGNMLLLNNKGSAIDSLNKSRIINPDLLVAHGSEATGELRADSDISILQGVMKAWPLLGSAYAKELLADIGVDESDKMNKLTPQVLEDIRRSYGNLIERLDESIEYHILSNERGGHILSLIPLIEYPESLHTYNDINEALQKRLTLGFIQENFGVLERRISDKLGTLKRRIKSSLKYVEDDTEVIGRAEKYKKWAELLMSCPNLKDKPGKSIILADFEGAEQEIDLNEELNILDNSKRYYDKARKTRESVAYNRKRAEDYRDKLAKLGLISGMLEAAETIDDLKASEKKLIELFGRKMAENQEQEDKFRKFELEGGFVLYVGKNAQNNDELTMRFARPNDLWFHARGAAGSHCVLRIEKNQKPGKDIIRKSAEIAAYYSQARNAKYVPVAYTYKKYVRKPKGSNPGSIVIDREEVVMASPKMDFGD